MYDISIFIIFSSVLQCLYSILKLTVKQTYSSHSTNKARYIHEAILLINSGLQYNAERRTGIGNRMLTRILYTYLHANNNFIVLKSNKYCLQRGAIDLILSHLGIANICFSIYRNRRSSLYHWFLDIMSRF